jgi:cytochrome c-type biogenesis protein CcmH/NrfG
MSNHELKPARGGGAKVAWGMGAVMTLLLVVSMAQLVLNPGRVAKRPAPQAQQATMRPDHKSQDDMRHVGELMQHIQANPQDSAAMIHLAEHFIRVQNWDPAE